MVTKIENVCSLSPRAFFLVADGCRELQTISKGFTITEKSPTRAFSWFKAPTSAALRINAYQPAHPL